MKKLVEILDPDSTLSRTADDEPIFILVARDLTAPDGVEAWARRAESLGVPDKKVAEARALAASMRAWQGRHGSKVPD